ncbi:MAG: Extracellular matrix protein PelF, glycosyltransferase, group 1 [uncultured Sulfurovum sp.]|uniref:Extracellular matrix protein PelF, glycosyltransferase, group 1 n=1 Tax=uncultured Sulfurovum sp. TaxID=269237 RepID=A0A6S6U0K2_9BACT|nr:MAG: Extracellular matrix protein PelF, glycosyltransferase, group 1 [uncultured Sulfurovum sp.]
MKVIHDTGEPDILIPSEGTYPYVRGGVSSWIAQLIAGLPQYKFGIVFIGSKRAEYAPKPLFEFANNLVYVVELFMFDETEKPSIKAHNGKPKDFEKIEELYQWFKNKKEKESFPSEIKELNFYLNKITEIDFLYSREAWYFIANKNTQNCSEIPFLDYFWTVRSIHIPIWKIAKLAKAVKHKGRIVHSPSTGYAGFLATLIANDTGKPFILTEHGIYTKERKIDLISSSLNHYKKLDLFRESAEDNYIQNMWVKFFEGIGKMSYEKANPILSLFGVAKETQIAYGANAHICEVIPNGVDVHKLGATLKNRPKGVPKIITLIGRVVSIKDIKTFIRAIQITAQSIPDIEAWIVGPDDEEKAYAKECHELIEILDVKKHIKFLGFQNIADILPQSGLLTLTSISEGMPLVILEGFAAGVPCVATDVGSCKELIFGGEDPADKALGSAGYICEIANVEALAQSYIKLLGNEEKWLKAQAVALKRVNTFYTQELFLNNYQRIYEDTFSKMDKQQETPWQE